MSSINNQEFNSIVSSFLDKDISQLTFLRLARERMEVKKVDSIKKKILKKKGFQYFNVSSIPNGGTIRKFIDEVGSCYTDDMRLSGGKYPKGSIMIFYKGTGVNISAYSSAVDMLNILKRIGTRPLENDCGICYNTIESSTFCLVCLNTICVDCTDKVDRCPYCRSEY